MPTVALSTPLQSRVGAARVDADGTTVGEVLRALEAGHPQLAGWLLDDRGRLREHVNVFVDGRSAALDHALDAAAELFVIQAISGGRS